MTVSKIILCNECGKDMSSESPTKIFHKVLNSGTTFEVEQTIKSISKVDDGTEYNICQACIDSVFISTTDEMIAKRQLDIENLR